MSSSNDDEYQSSSASFLQRSSPMMVNQFPGRADKRIIMSPPSFCDHYPSTSAAALRSDTKSSQNVSGAISIPPTSTSATLPSLTPSPDTDLAARTADSLSLSEPNSFGAFVESYSSLLSTFAFEKAKELAEKQISQHKSNDPPWSSLALPLSHIAFLEKQYMSLSFLAPKGFLRKDSNLKLQLEQVKHDLTKVVSNSHYEYFTKDLLFLINIRLDLIDFYEKLSLLGSAKNVEIDDLLSDIEMIHEKYTTELNSVGSVKTGSLLQSIGWEIEVIFNLLKCHSCTQNWDFFGTIIAIQVAQTKLTEWADFLQTRQSSKKSSFLKSASSPPNLYNWLLKVKATILSKLSLYFNEILSKYSNPGFDMRTISTKLQADYYLKIQSFQKRTDALAICLVFDARDVKFNPHGYEHPARKQESPKGIETFPAVLSVPSKPANHWPSVVMLISDRMKELIADKFVGFYDSTIQATYFLARVDPRVFLLCVYETKKSEKDSYVLKFMQELIADLKCGKIFSSLKLGAK